MYTKEGVTYVQKETMNTVLLRHFPELAPALKGKDNAFRPWNMVGKGGVYGLRRMLRDGDKMKVIWSWRI